MVWYSEVHTDAVLVIMTNRKVKIISFIIQKLNIRISRMYKILLSICGLSDGQQLVLGWELLRMISKQYGTVHYRTVQYNLDSVTRVMYNPYGILNIPSIFVHGTLRYGELFQKEKIHQTKMFVGYDTGTLHMIAYSNA